MATANPQYSVDGHSVFMATGGVEWQSGKPLLCLVHGAALDHSVWTLFTRYFARKGYNVLAPDLSGHARSDGPLLTTIESMGEWLNTLLEQVIADMIPSHVILVGHSMGSLVTLEAAAQQPTWFTHLALLGTSVPMRVGDALLAAAKANEASSRDMVAIFGHAYASQLGGNPVSGISVVNMALRLMEQAGDDVMFTDMTASHQYDNGMVAAAKVTAKTALILGEQDKMTPAKLGPVLAGEFDDATLEVLADCGHMMMSEQPEETLQAMIRAFGR